ncbi:MAG: cytochrome c biogenesis protein ResB [Pseudomonadota bacterium]
MNETATRHSRSYQGRSIGRILLAFLGSMNLAISLLVAIAVASAIGTILQQNQPYNDYIIKFGPYWFEVFEALDLYDVYSAGWFLGIMGFLLLSTSVCVYRNTPRMLKEIRDWRENVQYNSLRSFGNSHLWKVELPVAQIAPTFDKLLIQRGYATRNEDKSDAEGGAEKLLIARKGGGNRVGYILTHAAIVVICLGGLLDSRLPFKVLEWSGKLRVETRNISAADVPEISRLPIWNPSFRGSVEVPEGRTADVVFVNLRDGYLVQELPFAIEVKAFRVEHHTTGQPKSFESDLVIHDAELDEPLTATIAVNHPLVYKGYAIYQSSFGDGGSGLTTRLWALDGASGQSREIEANVNTVRSIFDSEGAKQIEFTDFRIFNINPVEGEDGEIEQRNFGPSMEFRVRDEAGQAREYFNYLAPIMQEGQLVMLSGMRESVADPYRFLHIPVDAKGGIGRFVALLEKARDRTRVMSMARESVFAAMQESGFVNEQSNEEAMLNSMYALVEQFLDGGFDAVATSVTERAPADKQEQVFEAYLRVLQTLMAEVYREVLQEEGVPEAGERELRWFDTAIAAINALPHYGTPFYLQLLSFDHIESSGLQITVSPGQNTVYLGCVMLMAGVFMLFYIQHCRLWVWMRETNGGCEIMLAGTSLRPSPEFDREFAKIAAGLEHHSARKDGD